MIYYLALILNKFVELLKIDSFFESHFLKENYIITTDVENVSLHYGVKTLIIRSANNEVAYTFTPSNIFPIIIALRSLQKYACILDGNMSYKIVIIIAFKVKTFNLIVLE